MADLILALDTPDPTSALSLLDRVPQVTWVKLGSVLFTQAGPGLIVELRRRGLRIFLDLKWHDIPNTVRGAVERARGLGVDMVSVHTLGGRAMMAAAKGAAGTALIVVGVTVLTSHDEVELSSLLGREAEPQVEVTRLAELARQAGIDGVVSSPLEVARLRAALGHSAVLVTPGIRAAASAKDDQARIATAGSAVRDGANFLVVGRPVLDAPDPYRAWEDLRAECS